MNNMEHTNIDSELVKANITDQTIASMRERFMTLKVTGLLDKVGYEAVTTARKEAKSFRVTVEKFLKQLREPAVAFQKSVIAKEKDIVGRIEEIEEYLTSQEEIYKPKAVVVDTPMTDEERMFKFKRNILAVETPKMDSDESQKKADDLRKAIEDAVSKY